MTVGRVTRTTMTAERLTRTTMAAALIVAPILGLASAAALPALRSTRAAEITAIAAHQDRFYLYAILGLISGYLLVPAIFGVMALLRTSAPMWCAIGGGLTQLGLLIAIGDGATELLYWQMGDPYADPAQMTALAQRYENAAGSSLPYVIGGLTVLIGTAIITAALWRTRVVPRWAALGVVTGIAANIVGFALASTPLLIVSYVPMLVAFAPAAVALMRTMPAPAISAELAPAA